MIGYEQLVSFVDAQLPRHDGLVLVGESFSGPVATRLAARLGARAAALVLCSTFVTPPRPRVLRHLARAPLFRVSLPERLMSAFMLSPLATPALVSLFTTALRKVDPAVLALRLREVLTVDDRVTLGDVRCPILYLRGTYDRMVTERALTDITRAAPGVQVERLAAPHAVLQTMPADAWAAIAAFLRKVYQTPSTL